MAQSNCFQVIDRGAALQNIQQEDALAQSGLLRSDSTTARGRLITTQYLITPNVVFSNPNAGGVNAGAILGGLVGGSAGALVGGLAGSVRVQEAQTALFLTDAQTGVQTGVAEGSARVRDFGGGAGLGGFGGGIAGFGGLSGYGNTAEGKLIAAAFLDAHNKLVGQVRATQPNLPAFGPGAQPTATETVYRATTSVNVRSGPGTNNPVIAGLSTGQLVYEVGPSSNGWANIQVGDRVGWVSLQFLQPQ
ncbi:MAG: CsgG/HfaB family protein [Maricaulaceae bacterium]